MKYFIPEWNDRVDLNYDFINDAHSPEHKHNPLKNDAYIWDIFGIDKVPIDGVLVSRITIEQNKRKYKLAVEKGIHELLHLPQNFEIIGDCGAFGYVDDKVPRYDPIETLEYYSKLGFNYGVTVDHLVVTQFKKEKKARMQITYENAVKAYHEWCKRFKNDFQLLLAVQGWDVKDYLKMYRDYIKLGATHIAFGGLARSPTSFITQLIDELTKEIKTSKKVPVYLHFFGLARFSLFPKFQELEDLGVKVGFDSASYLRKAWLSAASTQLNYLTLEGEGYSAIRIPFVKKKKLKTANTLTGKVDINELKSLEKECLNKLRLYDKGKENLENVLFSLSKFNKALGLNTSLIRYYKRTLDDKPWKSCNCPICKKIGIEVVIFRGNNRNRRRGFHNIYVFYNILKNPTLWSRFKKKGREEQESELYSLNKSDRVLVITGCTKKKLAYNNSFRAPAKEMYQGRLFKTVRKYCETMGFDYVIISAKYGLIRPDEEISGYEKVLKTKEDVEKIQPLVEEKLKPIIQNYDKILVIAGKRYREALKNLWNEKFITIKAKGYADLCNKVKKIIPKKTLLEFTV